MGHDRIPTALNITPPKGYAVQHIDWPSPKGNPVNDEIATHYEGSITAHIHMVPDGNPIDTSLQYTVHGSWQACNTKSGVCVRGSTVLTTQM